MIFVEIGFSLAITVFLCSLLAKIDHFWPVSLFLGVVARFFLLLILRGVRLIEVLIILLRLLLRLRAFLLLLELDLPELSKGNLVDIANSLFIFLHMLFFVSFVKQYLLCTQKIFNKMKR